jgi:rhamnosyltransferase
MHELFCTSPIRATFRETVCIETAEWEHLNYPMTYAVAIPTFNAAADWTNFAQALIAASDPQSILIVDSESTDGTVDLSRMAGFRIHTIPKSQFNHGSTRQLAVELLPDAEVIIFMTQDAVLADRSSISRLLASFADPSVAAAFGRQLPRFNANPIESHARLFNYSTQSDMRTLASRLQLGFKTIFISNSFAAYRRDALISVGGFPHDVIFGEDTITAAKLLLSGWKIAYVAEARVYHSHSYTWMQEFRRYFDIGVLHTRENWLLKEFGTTSGEGGRFVRSEIRYLWPKNWRLVPSAVIRNVLKLLGYRLGRIENRLSLKWKRRISMHSHFWKIETLSSK